MCEMSLIVNTKMNRFLRSLSYFESKREGMFFETPYRLTFFSIAVVFAVFVINIFVRRFVRVISSTKFIGVDVVSVFFALSISVSCENDFFVCRHSIYFAIYFKLFLFQCSGENCCVVLSFFSNVLLMLCS